MPCNYICALDIGSSKIAACLARLKRNRPCDLFFENVRSRGIIKKGAVVDSLSLTDAIARLVKILRQASGINVKYLYVNLSGQDIATRHSRAIIPLAERGNKVITAQDIQRVNEQARILGSSLEEEIIHSLPYSYSIDTKNNIKNPLGLYSHRLEVDLFLIFGRLSSIQSLTRAVKQAGCEIKDLFFSGLVTSDLVFDKGLKEGLNLFCDIGSDTTELLIFRDGVLTDIEILPIGGDDLTTQLSDKLEITFELAEDIKRSYGAVVEAQTIGEDKEILIKKNHAYWPIKQRLVSQIITDSAKSISSNIKEAIEKKVASFKINNLVVVGRSVMLEGLIETLENNLMIPVRLGRVINPSVPSLVKERTDSLGQKFLTYLTALGIACEALKQKPTGALYVSGPAKNFMAKAIEKFKEVYQEYF